MHCALCSVHSVLEQCAALVQQAYQTIQRLPADHAYGDDDDQGEGHDGNDDNDDDSPRACSASLSALSPDTS